jgi:hypothetical protein
MQLKTYILLMFIFGMFAVVQTNAETASEREYQLKAAFLYNFIMFVDWPAEKMPEANEPVIIGILGDDPFGNAFEPIKDKQAKEHQIIIQRFGKWQDIAKLNREEFDREIEQIRKSHLLFICSSEQPQLQEIMHFVNGYNILTVSDMENFLTSGAGIIKFVIEDGKIRFEINVTAAEKAKLEIRSQLLRLAKKVIDESQSNAEQRNEYFAKYDN